MVPPQPGNRKKNSCDDRWSPAKVVRTSETTKTNGKSLDTGCASVTEKVSFSALRRDTNTHGLVGIVHNAQ